MSEFGGFNAHELLSRMRSGTGATAAGMSGITGPSVNNNNNNVNISTGSNIGGVGGPVGSINNLGGGSNFGGVPSNSSLPGNASMNSGLSQGISRKTDPVLIVPNTNLNLMNTATGLYLQTQMSPEIVREDPLPKSNPEAAIQVTILSWQCSLSLLLVCKCWVLYDDKFVNFMQRREHMEIRAELEREIKRLQDQVAELKSENKKIKHDYTELEAKYNASKQKNQDVIANLRGKRWQLPVPWKYPDARSYHRTGKLVRPDSLKTTMVTSRSAIATQGPRLGPNRKATVPGASSTRRANGGNPSPENDDDSARPEVSGNFAGPTFNELMRRYYSLSGLTLIACCYYILLWSNRTTPTTADFHDVLRKPHLSTGYTNSASKPTQRMGSDGYQTTAMMGGMDMSELDGGNGYPYPQLGVNQGYPHSPMMPYGSMYPPQPPHMMPPMPPQQGYAYGGDPMTPYAAGGPTVGANGQGMGNPMQRAWDYQRRSGAMNSAGNAGMLGPGGSSSLNTATNGDMDDEREDADDLPVVEIDLR
jgi:hypothetical protein